MASPIELQTFHAKIQTFKHLLDEGIFSKEEFATNVSGLQMASPPVTCASPQGATHASAGGDANARGSKFTFSQPIGTPLRRSSGIGSSTSDQAAGPAPKTRPSYQWNLFDYFDSLEAAKDAITKNCQRMKYMYHNGPSGNCTYECKEHEGCIFRARVRVTTSGEEVGGWCVETSASMLLEWR